MDRRGITPIITLPTRSRKDIERQIVREGARAEQCLISRAEAQSRILALGIEAMKAR